MVVDATLEVSDKVCIMPTPSANFALHPSLAKSSNVPLSSDFVHYS